MGLTRAQLLMGDTSQGAVLRNQVQAVKRGVGINIAANGAISVDSNTITGVVRLNNSDAFNGYIWPDGNGLANQVLTTSPDGSLYWADIPENSFNEIFTAKGQLLAGTGPQAFTLQNVGLDTAFLVADSETTSGLIYTNNMTYAVLLPVGTSEQRDCACPPLAGPLTGQFRYSTTYSTLEFYNGTRWVQVHATDFPTETFVRQTVPVVGTASAVLVAGSTAQRQSNPQAGYLRYNSDTSQIEFYTGSIWKSSVYSVDASGGTTGLTFTGGPITDQGTLTLGGVLNLASGGTGASTQPAAANNILPPQAGNGGEYLATDGTNVSWEPIFPSQTGNEGEYLVTDGTNVAWQSIFDSLVEGTGIDITAGPGDGQATISFTGGRAIYFPPIYFVPAADTTYGSASGMLGNTSNLGPWTVTYPAGATRATIQTRTRISITPIVGADYSASGFIYINNPTITISIGGQATQGTGSFIEQLAGVVGGYDSGNVFSAGAFLIRTDELNLTSATGGTFTISLQLTQTSSGPNTVAWGNPQFYIQPYVQT